MPIVADASPFTSGFHEPVKEGALPPSDESRRERLPDQLPRRAGPADCVQP